MAVIGNQVADSIRNRIRMAMDVNDSPAPPLKVPLKGKGGYPEFKKRRFGGKPIRDWWRSGMTLRSLKVLSAGPSKAVIGFTNPEADKRAAINNLRWRQFGISPKDREVLARAVAEVKVIRVESAA